MNVIATAVIDGPEAKGNVEIVVNDQQERILRLKDGFWVAPGAPDVTLTISPNPSGAIDDKIIKIGMYEYKDPTKTFPLSDDFDIKQNPTIIVYCKQYTAHFGHGTLSFNQ